MLLIVYACFAKHPGGRTDLESVYSRHEIQIPFLCRQDAPDCRISGRFAHKVSMAPKRKTEASAENGDSKKQAKGGSGVNPARVRTLNEGEVKKGPVIYW